MLALLPHRESDYLDLIGWYEKEEKQKEFLRTWNIHFESMENLFFEQRQRDSLALLKMRLLQPIV